MKKIVSAAALTVSALALVTPAAHAAPVSTQEGPVGSASRIANGGPVGPGLSELVAIAEGILRKYGITKTF
ncbi:hypothetical protein EH183_43145 [Streptomyces sp. CB01881]|uniref:hypothetical protein n=1 Tax=Streptomyces sp. CB01881 TaxID=2078691 RepID=UPI0011DF546C|nr:hypothetical protein [Streptomyces sp. CB01881]TYC66327.1 hypothetical protein EH183_43145 [Streptomyces sp. CB01881]